MQQPHPLMMAIFFDGCLGFINLLRFFVSIIPLIIVYVICELEVRD